MQRPHARQVGKCTHFIVYSFRYLYMCTRFCVHTPSPKILLKVSSGLKMQLTDSRYYFMHTEYVHNLEHTEQQSCDYTQII